jgi:hypothetical protein
MKQNLKVKNIFIFYYHSANVPIWQDLFGYQTGKQLLDAFLSFNINFDFSQLQAELLVLQVFSVVL